MRRASLPKIGTMSAAEGDAVSAPQIQTSRRKLAVYNVLIYPFPAASPRVRLSRGLWRLFPPGLLQHSFLAHIVLASRLITSSNGVYRYFVWQPFVSCLKKCCQHPRLPWAAARNNASPQRSPKPAPLNGWLTHRGASGRSCHYIYAI
jgi:hypothetical protein